MSCQPALFLWVHNTCDFPHLWAFSLTGKGVEIKPSDAASLFLTE